MDLIRSLMSGDPMTLAFAASALAATIVAAYFYYDKKYRYFERLGMKTPRIIAPAGNAWAIFLGNRMQRERQWVRECGKFYGFYLGADPRFVVADPELLRQICIKDFDVFPNHDVSEFFNDVMKRFIFFQQDDHWKRNRAIQTPTFTSGKIKRMYKMLDCCADDLVACIREQLDESIKRGATSAALNLKDIYSLYTMDGIVTCGYGLKLQRARGDASIKSVASRNDFVTAALRFFEFRWGRILIFLATPHAILRLLNFHSQPLSGIEPIMERVNKIIATRKRQLAENKKFDDYLQILLDANLEDKMELSEMDSKEHHHAGLTDESLLSEQKRMVNEVDLANGEKSVHGNNKISMSDQDILCSALFLLVVGLETTATLLINCTYALAFHPEIQEKLHEEVSKIAELDATKTGYVFDYDSLTSCQYLDSVISEALRAISPVLFMDRVAKKDYYVEKYKVTIPEGSKVQLAYHAVMNDPDYWEEPEKFRPERFMPGEREKIVPGSYCPFGLGPRHCLGMRFSLTEAKLALAKVIMKYKFEPAPNTSYPPNTRRGMGLTGLIRPVVNMKLRN